MVRIFSVKKSEKTFGRSSESNVEEMFFWIWLCRVAWLRRPGSTLAEREECAELVA